MRKTIMSAFLACSVAALAPSAAWADSIMQALAKAYENNSALNSARAGVRVADENVPLAKSGMRPRVTGNIGINYNLTDSNRGYSNQSFGVSINQAIFDGFQTRNNVKAAEAGVRAQRENLRNTELNTLFDAAQTYVTVLLNRQIVSLRAQNLEALQEQVRSARSRFEVGEGTRTDVAQAEASLASARAQLAAAKAQVGAAEASYRELVGSDPKSLTMPKPLSKLLPNSFDSAIASAMAEHPAIAVRDALVDSSVFSVKVAEGAFLPQVGLSASVSRSSTSSGSSGRLPTRFDSAGASTSGTVGLNVTVPIYQGGQASANVRKSKESLGQARIDVDVARDQVRTAVVSAWTQLEASRAALEANNETVNASRLALNGVIEERNVGQRTTLDVLTAQSSVLNAQIAQAQAQANLIVSSYAVASATGRLTAKRLGLGVKVHDPEEHYIAVKDKWFGLRTPDAR